uniref:Multiple epidermal growth factor-like domains protein 10 isoform X4 n=1 Tax=Crassostrea virginica TaxID=6565 RepID=A0A8B8BMR4_CRAVI|nr:multiple epidermal growth factor-like domains protein 10 isoform X4 [Crassostrea virginica]
MSTTLFIHLGFIVSSFAYENIALKKPAYQQYPYTGPGPANHLMEASNAVDGLKTNLSIWGGQCVLSDNDKQTATWWVNLTSILSIHHVTIYYRTEVYGWECRHGQYGEACENVCGQCIDQSECHHVNGTCLNGCRPGYKGNHCSQTCEFGFYGDQCTQECGNCHNQTNCRHTNGSCASGCDVGFHGDLCKTECESGTYGHQCEEKCGQCKDLSKCLNTNGLCLTGCQEGYHGDLCKTRTSPKADEPVRNGWQMGGYMTSVGLIMIILFTLVYIVILSLIRIFRRCTPASQQDMKRENLNSAIKQKDSTEHAYTNRSYVELSDCRNGPEIENHETSADV